MSLSVSSYGAAAAAYGVLTAVLLLSRDAIRQGQRVLLAVAGTALWGAVVAALLAFTDVARLDLTPIPDALRAVLWIFCLLTALPGSIAARSLKGVIALLALLLGSATVVATLVAVGDKSSDVLLLALSILGCLTVEQILRNSTEEQKRVIKSFLWGIGAILIYDVFVFSDAVLFGVPDPNLWVPRGLVAAIAVPFFLLGAKRHPDWQETLFISRELVFYSATLTGVGLYLIAMAVGGFIIRERSGQWGGAIQLGYLVAALAVLGYALTSARLKVRLRVFISKHFYRNPYDYRDEWLRLIRTLSDHAQELPLAQRSIKALCAIVDSDGGQLWLDRDGRSTYEPFAAWQAPFPTRELSAESPLVRFLSQHEWVIDSHEYDADPEHYENAFRDEPAELPPDSLIVPLFHQSKMLGFVRLNRGAGARELNFEDHDLLKTAGRQVAAFLAHDLASARLAETQQFEAYNKLSAFVMHDLKNLLAQQALLVANAKRFGQRPEFLEDAIRTVDGGVQRMRRLLRQLEQGVSTPRLQRVELNKLILRAISMCAENRQPTCSFRDSAAFWVRANPDQLTSVVTHVIQNALDATEDGGGAVSVSLHECPDGRVAIEVRDNGKGMSAEFIRHKLFKPFETTKGLAGMGIGAHQAREIVRGLGGDVTVESEVGAGTIVTIYLLPESQTEGARPNDDADTVQSRGAV